MTSFSWGTLGPGRIVSERRTRALGLGAAVRTFNELAVPGLGGVWFAKPVFLATLGVHVAQKARESGINASNIEVANAIEALGCLLAFRANKWSSDPRLLGRQKLQNRIDLTFRSVRRRGFYVTQPMRMSTVQVLPALGLVESSNSRFNSFTCSPAGDDLVEAGTAPYRPYNGSLVSHLLKWIREDKNWHPTDALAKALSPTTSLPDKACDLVRQRLQEVSLGDDASLRLRRREALSWVETLHETGRTEVDLSGDRPAELQEAHWQDLRTGAQFFRLRDAALALLDEVESWMGRTGKNFSLGSGSQMPGVARRLAQLQLAARRYTGRGHTDANRFRGDCRARDDAEILRNLADRDGRVLRRVGGEIRPGPAFQGQIAGSEEDEPTDAPHDTMDGIDWPVGLSYRVRNLHLLNLDLKGLLDERIRRSSAGSQA